MPGADIGDRRIVVDRFGVDGFDQRDVVDHLRRVGQQFADPRPVLAVLLELVFRRRDGKSRLARSHRGQTLPLRIDSGRSLSNQSAIAGL